MTDEAAQAGEGLHGEISGVPSTPDQGQGITQVGRCGVGWAERSQKPRNSGNTFFFFLRELHCTWFISYCHLLPPI